MLNRVTMTGRLVAAPELRHTQSGVPVTSFRIANDRDYGKGEEKETDFFDVVAWRATAEFICKYFTRGRMISVDGRLQTRSWKDRATAPIRALCRAETAILRRISNSGNTHGGGFGLSRAVFLHCKSKYTKIQETILYELSGT